MSLIFFSVDKTHFRKTANNFPFKAHFIASNFFFFSKNSIHFFLSSFYFPFIWRISFFFVLLPATIIFFQKFFKTLFVFFFWTGTLRKTVNKPLDERRSKILSFILLISITNRIGILFAFLIPRCGNFSKIFLRKRNRSDDWHAERRQWRRWWRVRTHSDVRPGERGTWI